jgi:hypothetical protein
MVHKRLSPQVISSTLGLLLLVACSASQPIPTATPIPPAPTATSTPAPTATPTPTTSPLEARVGEWSGTTEFGSFTFVVSPDGKKITSLELSYQGGIASGSGSLTPEGEGMPIDEDGSFDLSVPDAQLIFRGQFSQGGTNATGLWEMDIPLTGTLSEEWKIER